MRGRTRVGQQPGAYGRESGWFVDWSGGGSALGTGMGLPASVARWAVALLALLLITVVSLPAQAAPYAGIVMDMRSGAVYYTHDADRRQHPASLTKMMTLYLTFEAIQRGQIGLDQKVRVSRHAARQPASKLYLKRGQKVSIRHLIRATAIRSANDAAMVLAEAIGGSQANFARLMTAKARELGMSKTTFKNPHGLTQKGHLSTARDMALLARHLYFDFPKYYNVFGRLRHTAAGKRLRTTNRLLATYRGAEGMKTGYTRAAGYNLVSVAARGSERVIAVVMGGKTSRSRNAQSKKLLDLGFRKAPTRVAVRKPGKVSATRVARAPLPPARPAVGPTGIAAIASALAAPEAQASVDLASRSRYAPLYASEPPPRSGADWTVALGDFAREGQAIALISALALDTPPSLSSARVTIGSHGKGSAKRYRVEVAGRDGRAPAEACRELRRHEPICRAITLK
ncbi:MAG: D-alanyl-D-alanine carboxypeptidase family protein [Pseudomonadota bacterium]